MLFRILLSLVLFLGLVLASPAPGASAQSAVVRVVYFYSPTCPACREVATEHLPPLVERYGSQFEIAQVDVTTFRGQQLFQQALEFYAVPESRRGVPLLVIEDEVLVGSIEIPTSLPGMIEQGLLAGGTSWPAIPGLEASVGELERFGVETRAPQPFFLQIIGRDPLGNGLSVLVLAGMVFTLYAASTRIRGVERSRRLARRSLKDFDLPVWSPLAVPALALIGLGASGYLTYIKLTANEALCGPVGDCNTVQQSQYAELFGLVPVGLIGFLGFLTVLIVWAAGRMRSEQAADGAALTLFGLTLAGTMFASYLTFLEPFVLGATCFWCLVTAGSITGLLWLSVDPARLALTRRRAR